MLGHGHLGYFYENGIGVAQNYGLAAKCYQDAANLGDADAQNNLASLYEIGRGVPYNLKEAIAWYEIAAKQGHAAAVINLKNLKNNMKRNSEEDGDYY